MCGIAGFWRSKAGDDHPIELLNRMGAVLAHRGPDDAGSFHDSGAGLGLAFRRLSIMDLSAEGHQPMTSASGRYVTIFNGEIYNFEEIRSELGIHAWRGHSDTEAMLEAIERWGLEAAVRRFVGMFAFALWDRQDRRLSLVRDRLGIKPLYYGQVNGHFVFASELKAIQQFPGFESRIDRDALALYMRFNYVPAPYSIYEGICKLEGGKILTLTSAGGRPVIASFWSALEVARAGVQDRIQESDQEVLDQLEERLQQAVRLRMIADVPLGAFLSGGIDSTTVVALMQSQSSRRVKTFTIGFHEHLYNEATHAKKIARHLGTEHTELYVTPQDALDVVPMLPAMYDEPFADSSQIPTHLVSKLAREHVSVALSGDGGDELFGGYFRYALLTKLWRVLKRIPGPMARSMADAIRAVPPSGIDRWLGPLPLPRAIRAYPGHKLHRLADHLAMQDPADIYLRELSQWPDPCLVVLGAREPDTIAGAMAGLKWLPSEMEMAMLTDLINYLPDDILTKVDRASMAVSLEARVPILDHRVVEFAWRLPLRFKIRDGKSKWALRQVLYRYVPRDLVERPKMGFGVPIDSWLRGPLREWAENLLSRQSLSASGFLAVEPIRQKWDEHLAGARNWQYQLWTVLMFQDWLAASVRESGAVAVSN
ncbi:MAG TPA: asparagine synthase (glutamine-hydrolyzing) [Candidatus Saccharimonadales bacterium]|jgi:asparagine synthase (glutamine-hydrolysing)|nr:asparagine synthase (glutamine-hydrolyzing) [Candidatus Saccharimonadales bacterium]